LSTNNWRIIAISASLTVTLDKRFPWRDLTISDNMKCRIWWKSCYHGDESQECHVHLLFSTCNRVQNPRKSAWRSLQPWFLFNAYFFFFFYKTYLFLHFKILKKMNFFIFLYFKLNFFMFSNNFNTLISKIIIFLNNIYYFNIFSNKKYFKK
jgi:hypothetical protein